MLTNEEDIGAETLKRYEYQKLWNLLLVLDFALHNDKKAIYSEFLDDITIEYFKPNQYEVIQVKTKDSRRFSINDKEIRKTLNIFLSIEEKFSRSHCGYMLEAIASEGLVSFVYIPHQAKTVMTKIKLYKLKTDKIK